MELNEAVEIVEKYIQYEDNKARVITEDCDECPYYIPRDTMYEALKVILSKIK